MKKIISSIILSALVLTAAPAFANDDHDNDTDKDQVRASLNLRGRLGGVFHKERKHIPADRFTIVGTVTAVSAANVTLTVERAVNASAFTEGESAIVNVNSDTKFFAHKDNSVTLADIQVGDRIVASGKLAASVYTATHVWDLGIPAKKTYGKVTAKTDTSVTILNNATGTSQTFTVDGDSKIAINGEAKTIADINVGDAGVVKSKAKGDSLWAKIIRLFR